MSTMAVEEQKKIRSTKVDAGNFKQELLNRLRSSMAVKGLMLLIKDKVALIPEYQNVRLYALCTTVEISKSLRLVVRIIAAALQESSTPLFSCTGSVDHRANLYVTVKRKVLTPARN